MADHRRDRRRGIAADLDLLRLKVRAANGEKPGYRDLGR